ncbi:MAG: Lrp/AsnC family transcriptional regulator, partial [Bacteroidales bacterium]|nr:Lrp/AsnC family transcriptional regulator [Bacteroidales bacterium]
RMHRLEKEGYIRRYTAVLDASKLGRGFLVFCSVRLRRMGKEIAHDFVERVRNIPEVAECYNISGEFDYLLKIYAPDMQYYNDFIINTLGTIESLGSIQSSFVMNEIKSSFGLPASCL